MNIDPSESVPALGPEEVAKLGGIFDSTWTAINSNGLLKGRHNVESLRDLVGQMVWIFHIRGTAEEQICSAILNILSEAANESLH